MVWFSNRSCAESILPIERLSSSLLSLECPTWFSLFFWGGGLARTQLLMPVSILLHVIVVVLFGLASKRQSGVPDVQHVQGVVPVGDLGEAPSLINLLYNWTAVTDARIDVRRKRRGQMGGGG